MALNYYIDGIFSDCISKTFNLYTKNLLAIKFIKLLLILLMKLLLIILMRFLIVKLRYNEFMTIQLISFLVFILVEL